MNLKINEDSFINSTNNKQQSMLPSRTKTISMVLGETGIEYYNVRIAEELGASFPDVSFAMPPSMENAFPTKLERVEWPSPLGPVVSSVPSGIRLCTGVSSDGEKARRIPVIPAWRIAPDAGVWGVVEMCWRTSVEL